MGSSVRRAPAVLFLVGLTLLLASCAAGANTAASAVPADEQAGFLLGLWHGLITPIAFIVSLFNPNVGIYEIHNNGAWYDFGFLLGIFIPFSGGARVGSHLPVSPKSRGDRASS